MRPDTQATEYSHLLKVNIPPLGQPTPLSSSLNELGSVFTLVNYNFSSFIFSESFETDGDADEFEHFRWGRFTLHGRYVLSV